MVLKTITIYDSTTQAYLPPQYYRTKGEAIRAFEEAIKNPECPFAKWPESFTLFEIGEFNDQDGTVETHAAKISLGTATEYKAKINNTKEMRT